MFFCLKYIALFIHFRLLAALLFCALAETISSPSLGVASCNRWTLFSTLLELLVVLNICDCLSSLLYSVAFGSWRCAVTCHGEGNGTHSSTLAWKTPWMEEPGRLPSMGSLRVRHDWATSLSLFTIMHWRRKWQPTPVFLPGESQGRGSLVGCRLWGHRESDTTEVT